MCVAGMFLMRLKNPVCFGLKKEVPEKDIFCRGADKDLSQGGTKRHLYMQQLGKTNGVTKLYTAKSSEADKLQAGK